jgi:hypothetical protein
MLIEIENLWITLNKDYRLKESMPSKIAGCFVTGSYVQENIERNTFQKANF